MINRELIRNIYENKPVPRCGFWMGEPTTEGWENFFNYFGTQAKEEIRTILKDDIRHIPMAAYYPVIPRDEFPNPRHGDGLTVGGVFENCETIEEVEAYPWPKIEDCDCSKTIEELKRSGDRFRASGHWSPFYHIISDMFGMENYFMKMFTHPKVILCATEHMLSYMEQLNRKLFEEAGGEVDAFFFANDLGTQLDLLVGPDQLEEFVFPFERRLAQVAKDYNKIVFRHSCGAVSRVIPNFIDNKIDVLHPIQAQAKGMGASDLSKYKDRLAFMGGVDTQQLLVHGTPEDVKHEVRRRLCAGFSVNSGSIAR